MQIVLELGPLGAQMDVLYKIRKNIWTLTWNCWTLNCGKSFLVYFKQMKILPICNEQLNNHWNAVMDSIPVIVELLIGSNKK